jgi:formylglycine-generating enzyme required for sulfatase activity
MRTMVRVAIAILASVLMASTAHAKRVALVVGINKYDNLPRERQLAKAVNDARALEAALKAVGFDVIRAEDVGRSAFNQAWQQLLNKLVPGDEVAVFFSGHGIEIEGGNYLVPRDVPAVGTGEARRLKNESLSFDEMRRDLAAHGPKLSLFILDACRDNPFTDTRGRSIGGAKGLVPVQAEYGTFIMFAAGARESALDRLSDTDRDPNSIYTRKLLPLLKQPGLRLPDVAQRVRGEVRQLANTIGHRQSPAYYDEGADDVCLAGCTPTQPQVSEAEQAWPWVKDTTDQSVLENFIKQFGNTRFGEEAKARLADLKKRQVVIVTPSTAPVPPLTPALCPDGREVQIIGNERRCDAPTAVIPPKGPAGSQSPALCLDGREVQIIGNERRCLNHPSRCDGVETLVGNEPRCLKPKGSFKDCGTCPEMVVIPAGEFMMGSPENEAQRKMDESPQRMVTVAAPFAVGKFEVTFAEWDACVAGGACRHNPSDQSLGRGKRPVFNVSWDDINNEYLPWLSQKTGKSYRLLTEAEWEYSARAGTTTPFSTGRTITTDQANFNGNNSGPKRQNRRTSIEVGSLQPNAFGLHDLHGNVLEWVEDCYKDSYAGSPTDGSAGPSVSGCSRVVRGGAWANPAGDLRSANRRKEPPAARFTILGFRVARTLSP